MRKVWTTAAGLLVAAMGIVGCAEAESEQPAQTAYKLTVASPINLEVDTAFGVSDTWTIVEVGRTYDSMVVVTTPAYTADAPPVWTRVRNANGSSFELMVVRVDGETSPVQPVDVTYLVLEEGTYSAAEHGLTLEAGRMLSTVTDRKRSWVGQPLTLATTFSSPVVVGQVMSANDAAPSMFWSRGRWSTSPPSSSATYIGKHVGEDPDTTRLDETLGYVVVEAGTATLGNFQFEAKLGPDTVRGVDNGSYSYPLANPGTGAFALLGSSGMDGGDGGWPVLLGPDAVSEATVMLAIDEDQLYDSERNHTTEQVSMLAFMPRDTCPAGGCDPTACVPGATGPGVIDGSVELGVTHSPLELAGIWCITGSLSVNATDLTDLSVLTSLVSVGSELRIEQNTVLRSLHGLENLDRAYTIWMTNNDQLTDVAALGGVETLANLCAIGNDGLQDLAGLDTVSPYNSVDLTGNAGLQSLDGLQGVISLSGYLFIQNSPELSDISALTHVTSVGNSLRIFNTGLGDLSGLENLASIGGELSIRMNGELADMSAVFALSSVGSLRVEDNPALNHCQADSLAIDSGVDCQCSGNFECPAGSVCADAATCVDPETCMEGATGPGIIDGDVAINLAADLAQLDGIWCVTRYLDVNAPDLTDLSGLSGIVKVGGRLSVANNQQMTDLSGLHRLRSTSLFSVQNMAALESIDGAPRLTYVRRLSASINPALANLSAASTITTIDGISLSQNPALTNLSGLEHLTSVAETISISNNFELSDISALSAITSIGLDLWMINNDELTTLAGLDNVQSIGRNVRVSQHDGLTSVSALANVSHVGGSIQMFANPLVPECEVFEFAERTGGACTSCDGNLACTTNEECMVPACSGASCDAAPAPAGTECTGGTCDGAGVCVTGPWSVQWGSSASDWGTTVATDDTAAFVAGRTYGDLYGVNAGTYDMVVSKRTLGGGSEIWGRQLGTAGYDQVWDVQVSADGDLLVAGDTEGDLAGPNLGDYDAVVMKLASGDGSTVWARQFGNAYFNRANALAESGDHIYVAGQTAGVIAGATGTGGAFVAKLTTAGDIVWVEQYGNGVDDTCGSVSIASDGNLIIAGSTTSSYFGAGYGGSDAYVAKVSSNDGSIIWSRQFGTAGTDTGIAAAVDPSDNVFLLGTEFVVSQQDGKLRKLSSLGNELWTTSFGGTNHDFPTDLALGASGNVFVSSYTQLASNRFDGKAYGYSGADGTNIWYRFLSNGSWVMANDIAAVSSGSVLIAGYAYGDYVGPSSGSADVFLVSDQP